MDLLSTFFVRQTQPVAEGERDLCRVRRRGGGVAVTNHSYANFNIWHGLHPHSAKPSCGAALKATRTLSFQDMGEVSC